MSKASEKLLNNIDRLSIKDIIASVKSAKESSSNEYLEVYPRMIKFVQKRQTSSAEDFVGIAHMVYGWMPTILSIRFANIEYRTMFGKIKKGGLTREDFMILKRMINNSMVGVSKFCHFINPEKYAIWDSRVCSKIVGKKAYEQQINNVDNYIAYK